MGPVGQVSLGMLTRKYHEFELAGQKEQSLSLSFLLPILNQNMSAPVLTGGYYGTLGYLFFRVPFGALGFIYLV